MSKKHIVRLSKAEQEKLQQLLCVGSARAKELRRAYILLASDENGVHRWSDGQIAAAYSVSTSTVERLRQRCVEEGVQVAIRGKKQDVSIPATVVDARVEAHLIALRCSPAPAGYSQWSMRLLARKMVELQYVEHISHETVRQVLKKTRSSRGA